MELRKTLGTWALEQNIRLLDTKYYDDENLYTIEEYTKIVPKDIEVPLCNETWEDRMKSERNELITLENNTYQLNNYIANDLILLEKEAKEIKKKQDEIKTVILTAMEEKNIKQIKDEILGLTITYTPEQTDIEKFDKDKFKEENPDLYDNYVTLDGKRKASIRITIK